MKRNELGKNILSAFCMGLIVWALFFCLCVVITVIDHYPIPYLQFLLIAGMIGLTVFVLGFLIITADFAQTIYREDRTKKDAIVLATMMLLTIAMVTGLGLLWVSPFPQAEPESNQWYANATKEAELARLTSDARHQAFDKAATMMDSNISKEQMRTLVRQDLINSYPPDIAKRAANDSVAWMPDDAKQAMRQFQNTSSAGTGFSLPDSLRAQFARIHWTRKKCFNL